MTDEICKVCKRPILEGQMRHGLLGTHYECADSVPLRREIEAVAVQHALAESMATINERLIVDMAITNKAKRTGKQPTLRSGRVEIEDDAEKLLVSEVKRLGGKIFKLKFTGVDGAPDRILFMPGGKVYFVELKRAVGGELEPSQEVLFPMLEARGTHIYIVCGILEVRRFIDRVLKGNIL